MGKEAKRCSKCSQVKPLTEFHKRGLGYQSHCKPCARTYIQAHYQTNKKYYLEKNKRKQAKLVEIIRSAKRKPCADCGVAYPYYVMDFDHREGEVKVSEIARLIHSRSIKRVLAEIAKCDVGCANCHRERTYARQAKK